MSPQQKGAKPGRRAGKNDKDAAAKASCAGAGTSPPRRRRSGVAVEKEVTLQQEQLRVDTEQEHVGAVRARKTSTTTTVEQRVPRGVEHANVEREPVAEADSGEVETLPDGTLSIPVFEEQIVVTKQLVVRERIIVRKHTVYEEHVVTAELRREQLEIDTDEDAAVVDERDSPDVE
jgi:uncharacterized protein (TIGR02271 family)